MCCFALPARRGSGSLAEERCDPIGRHIPSGQSLAGAAGHHGGLLSHRRMDKQMTQRLS